jgi:hypothetical protein|tara:strand:- start:6628 stop:7020 length:393 start_codon:yes stop_codon:yes gene_type:complete
MKKSQAERFRALAKQHDLIQDDFWKASQGFVIITRTGIEKVQRSLGIEVKYEVVSEFSDVSVGLYVVKAIGYNKDKQVESFGEASPKNCRNAYPVAMAEKRALSRVILKMADMYELGVYSEDEGDFKRDE